jgi:ParB family chromosome partitioning protein
MDLNGWSTHDVARELAVDQSSVVRALKLLELPAVVQEKVEQGALSPATGYEVSKLDDPGEQAALADRIIAEGLSRSEAVDAVHVHRASGRSARGKGRGARRPTRRVFRKAAGCTVTVENGRGLDPEMVRAALAEAMARLDAETGAEGPPARRELIRVGPGDRSPRVSHPPRDSDVRRPAGRAQRSRDRSLPERGQGAVAL